MKLIVITSNSSIRNESSILASFFEMGLQTLHLRKPNYSTSKMKQLIQNIPEQFHNRIVIHSHHNLALKFDLKGIHLTKKHRNKKFRTTLLLKYLKYRNPHLLITTSHSKIGHIIEGTQEFDYIFLSPIFDSASSKYQAGFTEHSLRGAIAKTSYKIVARGGIEVHHIQKVHELGFYGMVINSAIWTLDDPLEEFTKYLHRYKELGLTLE